VAKAESRAQKYSLTPRGTKVLERWAERAFPDVLPADTEAVLRIVGLVGVIGEDADRNLVPPFLMEAARLKERSAEQNELKAKQHFEIREREWNEYLWMSNLVNAQRLRGEAAALTRISESFGDGVPRTCRTYSAGSKEEPSVRTGDDSVKKGESTNVEAGNQSGAQARVKRERVGGVVVVKRLKKIGSRKANLFGAATGRKVGSVSHFNLS